MNKAYYLIVLRYWRRHIIQLSALAILVILCSASVYSSILLIRSNKKEFEKDVYNEAGFYDYIIYDADNEAIPVVTECISNQTIGYFYEIGYISRTFKHTADIKIGCFGNQTSEQLYHMECYRGRHPISDNEISLDTSLISYFGLSGNIGEKISVNLFDAKGNETTQKDYTVCGFFMSTNPAIVGGNYRYPWQLPEGMYTVPIAFVSGITVPNDTKATIFGRLNEGSGFDYFDVKSELDTRNICYLHMAKIDSEEIPLYIMGAVENWWKDHDSVSGDSAATAISEDLVTRDFYSTVCMPVFIVVIFTLSLLTLINMINNIVNCRKGMYSRLRMLGMPMIYILICSLVEFLLITILFTVIGVFAGRLIHVLEVLLIKATFNINYEYGFSASEYVDAVTPNPLLWTLLIPMLALVFALIPCITEIRKTPASLTEKDGYALFSHKDKIIKEHKNWLYVLNSRISINSIFVAVILVIVISVGMLGYVSFRAYSDMVNIEYKNQFETEGFDYTAVVADSLQPLPETKAYNHHEYGISLDSIKEITNNADIDRVICCIKNLSTRITYNKDAVPETIDTLLHNDIIGEINIPEDEPTREALIRAHTDTLNRVGYSTKEISYQLPTIGVQESFLKHVNVVSGHVNYDKLESGEEVVIAVTSDNIDKALNAFKIGDLIPLNDIVLDADEDRLNFGYMSEDEYVHTYDEEVKTEDGIIPVFGSAYGKRKNITTKIGAIVELSPEDYNEYMAPFDIVALCLDNRSFIAWGLPDVNYTCLKIKMKDGYNRETINKEWYNILSNCEGLETLSNTDAYERLIMNENKVICVFLCLIVMVISVGCFSVPINMYYGILKKENTVKKLRAIGMSRIQVLLMILGQNFYYPLIAALTGIIPISLIQSLFVYVRSVADNNIQFDSEPWFFKLPFRSDLFSYGFGYVLSAAVIIGFIVIMAGVIPQCIFISRKYRKRM